MRTTKKDLERLLVTISNRLGRPNHSWVRKEDGTLTAQIGALRLECNGIYGGWDLVEIMNESGGVTSLIGNSFAGRGRLHAHEMESFLLGMLAALDRVTRKEATNGSSE